MFIMAITVFILGMLLGIGLDICIRRIPKEALAMAGDTQCPSSRAKIPLRTLLVVVITGICMLLSYLVFGLGIQLVLTGVLLAALIVIAFIDAAHKIIPDRYVVIILALGVVNIFVSGDGYLPHLIGLVAVSVPLLVIAVLTGGLGGGDVKLMAAAGLFLGWSGAVLAMILGSFAGAAFAVYLLASKRAGRKSEIPFGPFLAVGIGLAALFGAQIIRWYFGIFLS